MQQWNRESAATHCVIISTRCTYVCDSNFEPASDKIAHIASISITVNLSHLNFTSNALRREKRFCKKNCQEYAYDSEPAQLRPRIHMHSLSFLQDSNMIYCKCKYENTKIDPPHLILTSKFNRTNDSGSNPNTRSITANKACKARFYHLS